MPFLTTADDTNLHYTDWGEGAPVVFTHSWALNGNMWDYQIPDFVEGRLRCVTYDRRGHGRSDQPGIGYDLDTLADDLAALIERLDLHDVTLIGHSFGAKEIVRYVTRHGRDRVARAVLVAPTTPFLRRADDNPDGLEPAAVAANEAALRRDVPAWCATGAETFWGPAASASDGMTDWVIGQIVATPLPVLVETLRTNIDADTRPDVAAFDVPTLILHGDADVSAPIGLTGRPTAALLPNAKLVEYEGIGHGIYVSEHERINPEMLAFVSG